MNVIWQLPGDILHSVYSEWLGWKDVSRLDVACVGKSDREVWLTSLSSLRMTTRLTNKKTLSADNILRIFYRWLWNRKIFFVEGSIISLNILRDLVRVLDLESYCPALRSVEIKMPTCDAVLYGIKINISAHQLEDYLSAFLSHCHSLQGVTITMLNYNRESYHDVVFEVLVKKLRDNSLFKISLTHVSEWYEDQVMLATLLAKHASSLRDFTLNAKRVDLLFSTLIENHICLRVLDVYFPDFYGSIDSLISYLPSAGDLLESLTVGAKNWYCSIDDLIVSVAISCPKLTRLECNSKNIICSMEKVRLLYEQCPHLRDVSIDKTIHANNDIKNFSISVKGSNEDWAVCLFHALRRRQYKQVTLRLREDHYHPVENLKSLLELCEIRLDAYASNESLISLLQDLPRLNSLYLSHFVDHHFTDATLSAVTQHAKSLTELFMEVFYANMCDDGLGFSEELMSDLIKTCQLLERLRIPSYGLESLVAVSKHTSLKYFNLIMFESVPEEMLDGLLLDDKVIWPSTLEEATVDYSCNYEFNKKSRHWSKQVVNLMT
eukprot:scaffold912_cov187-Ochromonas_danica.AAC.54